VPTIALGDAVHESVDWSAEEVAGADCVVMLTPHKHFLEQRHWGQAKLVVDTRNVVPAGPTVWSI
jgi:UDP-N-acetyl-D-mannosaminuronate dehydrogenase